MGIAASQLSCRSSLWNHQFLKPSNDSAGRCGWSTGLPASVSAWHARIAGVFTGSICSKSTPAANIGGLAAVNQKMCGRTRQGRERRGIDARDCR